MTPRPRKPGPLSSEGRGCPADLNGDFRVDVQDLLILLANWGPYASHPHCFGSPDLNGSGAVDVQDLLILLGSWGPCPGVDTTVLTLSQELDEAGLTQQQFNNYLDVMMGGAAQRVKDNWTCWFNNYITQCKNCPVCNGPDPFAN